MSSLKRIPVSEVVSGMFINRLDGSWLSHPFWRRSFLIESDSDLRTLRESAVTHVWIDVAAGRDVATDAGGPDGAEAPRSPPAPGPAAEPAEPERVDDVVTGGAALRPAPTEDPPAARAGATRLRPARHLPDERDWQKARQIRDQARRVVGRLFEDARAGQVPDTDAAKPVIDSVIEAVSAQPGTLVSLSRLKNKDDYTFMHSVAVCALMTALAIELELDADDVYEAATAGLLHDIGKMAVDHDVLNKPGKLTDAEFDEIKRHTTEGHRILVESGSVTDTVMDVARHHHERIDGNGYPDRLKESQISLFARMGTVCDVYDAITSDRPYKKAWEPSVALQYMAKWAPGAYDPLVFQAFVRSLGVYPNGSLVSLTSGRIAIVVEQSEGHLLAPIVKVFYSTKSAMPILPELIDLSERNCRERIVNRVDPAQWGFGDLGHLWMPR